MNLSIMRSPTLHHVILTSVLLVSTCCVNGLNNKPAVSRSDEDTERVDGRVHRRLTEVLHPPAAAQYGVKDLRDLAVRRRVFEEERRQLLEEATRRRLGSEKSLLVDDSAGLHAGQLRQEHVRDGESSLSDSKDYWQTTVQYPLEMQACGPDRPDILTNYSGVLTSPYYPYSYPPNSFCQWRIISQQEQPQGMVLAFSDISLASGDCVSIEPYNNTVGLTTTKPKNSKTKFCEQLNPGISIAVEYSDVNVTFLSSVYSGYNIGFRALYTSDYACNYMSDGDGRSIEGSTSGVITSPFYPETPVAFLGCKWYTNNTWAQTMSLTINYRNLGTNCDSETGFLRVCDSQYGCRYACQGPTTLYLEGYIDIDFYAGFHTPLNGFGFSATYVISYMTTGATTSSHTIVQTEADTSPATTIDVELITTEMIETTISPAVTTFTTSQPVTTTTPSQAPDIYPEPFVKMTLNGSVVASNTIDSSCSNSYQSEFRKSFEDVISRANRAITDGNLCVGDGALSSLAGNIQFMTLGNEARVTFSIVVGLNPGDTVTFRSTELCAYDVSYFVQNFNNWRQPIIPSIYGCPSTTFNPTTFDLKTAAWSCA